VIKWKVGLRVCALVILLEDDAPHNPQAVACEPGWCHALPGDVGEVIDINRVVEDGETLLFPLVRFELTQTVTMCCPDELRLVVEA
jgi:hypothetical protein